MKIVALNGMLGYGYDEASLRLAFEEKVDYIGVDAGSIDPGPYYLGSGHSFTDRMGVKRDLSLALPLAKKNGAQMIVGTSGGSGSHVHVDWLYEIVQEVARENGLELRVGVVYSDVDNEYVAKKLEEGKIINLGDHFPLTQKAVKDSCRIVSQIGAGPIISLLKEGVDLVIAGRACDTAIYAAPCILNGYDPGLTYHMAKIMECGAMCAEPVAAADVMQGYITKDYFELRPANPARRCTIERVAAHTLYEQSDPLKIVEPEGCVDLTTSRYEQVDGRTVRVYGSGYHHAEEPTLKLEGVKLSGYRTISIAGINDGDTIIRLPELCDCVRAFIEENAKEMLKGKTWKLQFRRYGGHALDDTVSAAMGVVIDVVAETQALANTICSLARTRLLHCDFMANDVTPARKSTAGNLAFPFSPSDVKMGEVYELTIYHLTKVDHLEETAKTEVREIK